LLVGALGLGWNWYTTWRWLESTDDAYTQADNIAVVPKVSGYISQLLVTDNQRVKAGEVLLRIDPHDYQAAVDQAQSDVAAAEADIRNLNAQISQQQAAIDQAHADVASAEANLLFRNRSTPAIRSSRKPAPERSSELSRQRLICGRRPRQ
jgi:membrane fusion protein, multidrug efflux system